MKKSFPIIWVVFTLFSRVMFAQIYDDSFNPPAEIAQKVKIPNSPEAQAFTQYGNTTVDMFHGTPNIQIPIYTHGGRELNFPISLSYDASGIKVEQRATSAGLGWNLNLGGRISRIANGYPDDYISAQTPYQSFWNSAVNDDINLYLDENQLFDSRDEAIAYLVFLRKIKDNEIDTQPDFFSFNALGVSDMIVIDRNTKQAIALNNPRLKVTFTKTNPFSSFGSINSWTVTLDDGTILVFSQSETTNSTHFIDIGDESGLNNFYGAFQSYKSSWQLSSITSPTGKDTYTLNYTPYYTEANPLKATLYQGVSNPLVSPPQVSNTRSSGINNATYNISQAYVNRITHNGSRIVTIDYGSRYDTDLNNKINAIKIYDQDTGNDSQDLHRTISFEHSYFGSGASNPSLASNVSIRLKLDALETSFRNPLDQVQRHAFEYISPGLIPSTLSMSQDYYGFYNGQTNSVLYPRVNYQNIDNITDGADRSVSISHARIGTLNKITYPTGGHTILNYESHLSSYVSPQENTTQTTLVSFGSNYLVGGTYEDFNDPDAECTSGGYCYDNTISPAKVEHTTFNIEQEGTYLLNYSLTGNFAGIPGIRRAYIIKRSDAASCNGVSELSFDDAINNSNGSLLNSENVIFDNQQSGGANIQQQPVFLSVGCYQITLVNSAEGAISQLNLEQYVTTSTTSGGGIILVPKAGLRVYRTEDYTAEGNLALTKRYSYSDGVILSQPVYQSISTQYSGNVAQPVETQFIHRTSYASGTDKPHIGYQQVTETIVGENEEDNISTSNTFYIRGQGQNNSGIYQYHIDEIQTSNNYTVNYEFGKPKQVSSKSAKDYTEYDQKSFYLQRGLHFVSIESDNFHYPIPKLSPATGKWFIDKVPQQLFSTYAGGFLGEGLDGLATGPPIECDATISLAEVCRPGIARMRVYTPTATGSAGHVVLKRSTQKPSTGPNSPLYQVSQEISYTYYDGTHGGTEPVNFLPRTEERTITDGNLLKREFKYPENYTSGYDILINNNMVTTPVEVSTYSDNLLIGRQKTDYIGVRASKLSTQRDGSLLEERIVFDQYKNGNLVQSHLTNGLYTTYIWGYDHRYLIAKVDNMTLDEVENLPSFGANFVISEALSSTQEAQLRSVTKAQVTTYTYLPNVGVLTTRDPRGYLMQYEYDSQNRLIYVKDQNGKIYSKNEYNYTSDNQ